MGLAGPPRGLQPHQGEAVRPVGGRAGDDSPRTCGAALDPAVSSSLTVRPARGGGVPAGAGVPVGPLQGEFRIVPMYCEDCRENLDETPVLFRPACSGERRGWHDPAAGLDEDDVLRRGFSRALRQSVGLAVCE